MLTTIKGYYEHGKVFLQEEAPVSSKTEVIVTFLPSEENMNTGKLRMPGGLKGKGTIPDDFNEPLEDLRDYM
jgi:hypothetical protein